MKMAGALVRHGLGRDEEVNRLPEHLPAGGGHL